MKQERTRIILFSLMLLFPLSDAAAQINARMLRHPDVSETQIAFVYAGDIWVAPKAGGTASRLSSPKGEESFPRFSPDGRHIAFTGNYDGNQDIYVLPTQGGEIKRITHHPMFDRMLDWYSDGEALLFASSMHSGRQRYRQFYKVSRKGGLPEKLPIHQGEFGTISADGRTLAYTFIDRSFSTWKRYRGGSAPDIWLFDLETYESENITNSPANELHPMWHGDTVYFLSDRGPKMRGNIWAYDTDSKDIRQVTRFEDFDVRFPAIGPTDLVFEAGGRLYLLDLVTEAYKPVDVQVVTDRASVKPRTEKVGDTIQNATISPSGKRAIFQARGDLFSVPAEHGPVRNLTRTSGAADRFPAWSPDGKHVAYWTDRLGEYQLVLRSADGSGGEMALTDPAPGYQYTLFWSPDSRKLAYIDHTNTLRILDRDSKKRRSVDQDTWLYHGGLIRYHVSWSSDSRWLAYARNLPNFHRAVFLYDTKKDKRHQVTEGFYIDHGPVFDPDGKYLYLLTDRKLSPSYSELQPTWIYANTTQIAAVSLRNDVPSPLAPRNDDESDDEEEEDKDEEDEEDGEKKKDKDKEKKPEPVEIDIEDFERRLVVLPPKAGNYSSLQAAPGKVVYRRRPRTGSEESDSDAVYYDLEEREEKTILENVGSIQLSADGKRLLVGRKGKYAILDLKPDQKFDKTLATDQLESTVDPPAEWRQMFREAWRLYRDYFYDPSMHQVDWDAMHTRYGALLDDAVTRWDVNYVIGELIGEVNASHTYRGGGDSEQGPQLPVGLLGVDWSLENGAYRIKRIVRGADWDNEVRSPFDEPGVDVSEDDYVLAVNGQPLAIDTDPWAAFSGLSGKTVELTINGSPSQKDAKQVIVKTLTNSEELRLRHLAWVEANRQRVEKETDGRVGYVYVPNTGVSGQTELLRQYVAQVNKKGLIIDERFNSGGQLGDRFVELLNRPPLTFLYNRNGPDLQWPTVAHYGPQAMLINGWSGSGGDAFPWMYRQAKRGPIIGTRTWGGLIGPAVRHRLIDGGMVVVPPSRLYGPDGKWFAEGHGVEPDIHVPEDPTALARGTDTQLMRAIEEVERLIREQPSLIPTRPAHEDRSGSAGK